MLTLTETVDAIHALDTETDIILGACKRIANPDKYVLDNNAPIPSTMASQILNDYKDKLPPDEFSDQMLKALAAHTAMYCRPGSEVNALKNSIELLTHYFITARKEAIRLKMETNPSEAIADLLTMMKSLSEAD